MILLFGPIHTSSPGAICAISMAALNASADNLAIDILRIIRVDIASAAAAV